MNGQTMYQKNVHDPLTYPYKFIKPDTGSKLGKRVRKDKDYRPDTEVKAEMLEIIRSPDVKFPGYPPDPDPSVGRVFATGNSKGFNPVMAFDDRPSVIRMWKEHGLTVADVGNGVEF